MVCVDGIRKKLYLMNAPQKRNLMAGDNMRIGFIGAGKVGFTLGKYILVRLEEQNAKYTKYADITVSGYYSKHETSAAIAAEFTNTRCYSRIEELVNASDVLLITVPDDEIIQVWNELQSLVIRDKFICHCSGAMTSQIFSGVTEAGASSYSIHPMYAISSKMESYKEMHHAFFTVEGDPKWAEAIRDFIRFLGNACVVISAENKVRYHSAAVFASNLVTGMFSGAMNLLKSCGFNEEQAEQALGPLFLGNALKLSDQGPYDSLTGPVERNDFQTVQKHLNALSGNEYTLYLCASREVLKVAQKKHPERDYSEMQTLLSIYEQTMD